MSRRGHSRRACVRRLCTPVRMSTHIHSSVYTRPPTCADARTRTPARPQHLFPPETFSCKGIRTLTSIAAAALRTHLLHSINAAAVEAAAAEGAAEAAAAGPRPGRRGGAGVARAPPMRRSLEGGCAESAARQQRRLFRLQQYQAAQHARDSASLDGTSDLGSLRGGSDDGDVASSRSCAASPLPHRWPGLRGGAKGEGGEAPGALAVLGEDAGAEAEGGNNKGACEGPCTCGICMDHACALRIRGCRHGLCDECARHLLQARACVRALLCVCGMAWPERARAYRVRADVRACAAWPVLCVHARTQPACTASHCLPNEPHPSLPTPAVHGDHATSVPLLPRAHPGL